MTAGVAFTAFALPGTTGTVIATNAPAYALSCSVASTCPWLWAFPVLWSRLCPSVASPYPRCHLEPQGEILNKPWKSSPAGKNKISRSASKWQRGWHHVHRPIGNNKISRSASKWQWEACN